MSYARAFLLFLPVMGFAQQRIKKVDDFEKLKWIVGTWTRQNMRPGTSGTERWEIVEPGQLTGIGITLQGNDTAFIERLQLIEISDTLYFVADLAENTASVRFRVIDLSQDSFVCENLLHDFPKRIIYRHEGNRMHATISGNGKSVAYYFLKID